MLRIQRNSRKTASQTFLWSLGSGDTYAPKHNSAESQVTFYGSFESPDQGLSIDSRWPRLVKFLGYKTGFEIRQGPETPGLLDSEHGFTKVRFSRHQVIGFRFWKREQVWDILGYTSITIDPHKLEAGKVPRFQLSLFNIRHLTYGAS